MQFQIAANNTFLLARIKLLRLLGLLFGLGNIQHGTLAIPVLNGYSRCCYVPCLVHFRYGLNVLDSNLNIAAKVSKGSQLRTKFEKSGRCHNNIVYCTPNFRIRR
ncbi:Piso0_003267 [Millerozyma farinosa CBS 7064]|uniref:Piso0_003267 protein n=1 Tax=Pichia sorbitophila (strain ATCC MYA-4447 / BCRC 22081 / CBS 7064 / NBRC 10061 / NRRL Y-12695) TaxID=559304 RepID=G8YHM8_PICSO|nr:Piso0_003267 [Millerozyma farinosa CBS 7064]CCE80930.1 Piso0_003267 [Millerozyma farinosa CBS 7064]